MWRPTTRRSILLALALGGVLGRVAPTAAQAYSPAEVKAAFLYRFASYITWPAGEHKDFTICVLGDEDVYLELQKLLTNRQVNGRPSRVRRLNSIRELGDAQMLHIGSAFVGDLGATLRSIAGKPVLVVTDRSDGLEAGSMVNFLLADRRIRFEISLPSADQAGLKISSELLSVAARVQGSRSWSDMSCLPSAPPGMQNRCDDHLLT